MADELGTSVSAEPSATPQAPAAAPIPAASAPAVAIPQQTQAPATGAVAEDRSSWVPPYRLRETREAAAREAQAQWATKEAEYQARLNQIQTQLHALVGVQPPQNPEIDAVRQQFSQLFPQLAKLEERGADVLGLLERAGDLESQTSHYWQSYGRQTMDRLFEHAATSFGAPLSEEGKRALHSSFVGFVQSSPELTARYANDPTIIEDFLRMFTSSFIDPVRRSASATVAARVPGAMPQDTSSGTPPVSSGPKPTNLDERAAQGWAQYQQSKRP